MARPKEAILSRNLIRDQALAIIDEDGLDALTMRRLATRLGVQAASLYTHFANKEAVLDAIADRLAKHIDPAGFSASWQSGLRTWANSYYTAIHWHPHAAPVVADGARAHDLVMVERVQDGLTSHGWPARHATMVTTAVKYLVLGAATTASTAGRPGAGPAGRPGAGPADRPAGQPPSSGLDHFADTIERASFTFALDGLLAGLESVYEAVAEGRPRLSAGA